MLPRLQGVPLCIRATTTVPIAQVFTNQNISLISNSLNFLSSFCLTLLCNKM